MASLRSPKRVALFSGLSPAIEAAGFSESEAPDTSREIIGRSELLAKPRAG
jgi:serine/threonine-protein kinase HipA